MMAKRRGFRFPYFEQKGITVMIEIQNLNKTYHTAGGDIVALRDINLTIQDGEIFGIIGLSGAGKSTLVRCINLLERPTDGAVLLDGKDLMQLSQKELLKVRQSIGMIFQGFNLLEQRTVLRNICFPLEIAGVKKAEAVARAEELLQMVGLADRRNAYPSQLSGGQKQRVAIARALATRPKYLLCDEATSALDPNTTRSILSLLQEINRTLGVTIIVITHEMRVIDQICDRVAVIDQSRIAETGVVSEVFANPQSQIARELILPESAQIPQELGGKRIRIVFDGENSTKPVIASIAMECQVPVNILFADTKDMQGKAYGQMLLQLPEDARQADKVLAWLRGNGIQYREEA
jgi:D-methionine transport system ATP-binding protein